MLKCATPQLKFASGCHGCTLATFQKVDRFFEYHPKQLEELVLESCIPRGFLMCVTSLMQICSQSKQHRIIL